MKSILFMEGFSCQSHLIERARLALGDGVSVLASHRSRRPDILDKAEVGFIQPEFGDELLSWMKEIVSSHGVELVHAGKRMEWYEQHRETIEGWGTRLVTGSTSLESLQIADHKYAFAQLARDANLPVVPSLLVNNDNLDDMSASFTGSPFDQHWGELLCVKPARGVFASGFWIFNKAYGIDAIIDNPINHQIDPALYLDWLRRKDARGEPFEVVLMPYLPGPERSVDIVMNQGQVISCLSRRKEKHCQMLEQSGDAVNIAISCAELLNGDGLINVQLRNAPDGSPVLLEANMRPSGGCGYGIDSGSDLVSDMLRSMLFDESPQRSRLKGSRIIINTRAELMG